MKILKLAENEKKMWTLDEIQKTVFVMQNKIVIKNYFYLFYGKF